MCRMNDAGFPLPHIVLYICYTYLVVTSSPIAYTVPLENSDILGTIGQIVIYLSLFIIINALT